MAWSSEYKIDKLKAEVEALRKERDELQQETIKLRHDRDRECEEATRLRKERGSLKQTVALMSNTHDELRTLLAEAYKEITRLKARCAELEELVSVVATMSCERAEDCVFVETDPECRNCVKVQKEDIAQQALKGV